jgi:hypothetical protein
MAVTWDMGSGPEKTHIGFCFDEYEEAVCRDCLTQAECVEKLGSRFPSRLESRLEELAHAIEKMEPNESARTHLRTFWEMADG